MQLRHFKGRNVPEVMQRVREALGPDAVILSSREVEDGGGVHITAALENEPFDETEHCSAGLDGTVDELAAALEFHRLPPRLIDRLMNAAAAIPADSWEIALAGALDSEFGFAEMPSRAADGPLMLIGLSGAGKTATAAKLCARLRERSVPASLITMDAGKAGGLAQVVAFGKALDVHVDQADDAESLRLALADRPADSFAVIDTMGVNPLLPDGLALLEEARQATGAQLVLVMPAGGDVVEAAETALAFGEIGAQRLIATRLDSARRLGGVLSAARAAEQALMAAGLSPHIAGGLLPINPVSLARLLLPEDTSSPQSLSGQP